MRSLAIFAALGICLSATAATVPVTVTSSATFNPANITINAGDTVQWNWAIGAGTHTTQSDATSGPEVWNSGALAAGSFSHIFNNAGTYPYYCVFHGGPGGIGMSGSVQVNALAAPPTASSVLPTAAAPGATVTITGLNFQNGATVTFGGVTSPLVTFVNATTLQVSVPTVAAGPVAIVVTNPDAQTATLNGFTVLAAGAVPALSHGALVLLAFALTAAAFVVMRR
jgi:plastocyanin